MKLDVPVIEFRRRRVDFPAEPVAQAIEGAQDFVSQTGEFVGEAGGKGIQAVRTAPGNVGKGVKAVVLAGRRTPRYAKAGVKKLVVGAGKGVELLIDAGEGVVHAAAKPAKKVAGKLRNAGKALVK